MGIAALAVSTGGVVTAAHPGLVGNMSQQSVQVVAANALNGVSGTSRNSQLAERKEAVSRDSSRTEAAEAADETAVNEAEAKADERTAALERWTPEPISKRRRSSSTSGPFPCLTYHLTARFGRLRPLVEHAHRPRLRHVVWRLRSMPWPTARSPKPATTAPTATRRSITLEDGTDMWFCHQTSYTVSVGDVVRSGDLIGYVGSTGNTTGAAPSP